MRLLSNRSIKTDSQIDQISKSRQREILISKWRALPSLYWSIVVGILAIFSVLQTTLLSEWSNKDLILLLLALLGISFVGSIVIAIRQKTSTEKLALAWALFTEAGRLFDERDYHDAAVLAERSVELDSENSMTWSILGRIWIRLGMPTDAIHAFEHAINVNKRPEWRTIYLHNRALARILNRDFGHARNDLNACIAEKPNSSLSLRWRALACYYMGDYSAALADSESSVRKSPCRIPNQAVLAIVSQTARKTNQAENATETALSLRPERSDDYYYLAVLKVFQSDRDEALRLLGISIQLDDKMKSRAYFDPFWDCIREDAGFKSLVVLNDTLI